MNATPTRWRTIALRGVLGLALVGGAAAAVPFVIEWRQAHANSPANANIPAPAAKRDGPERVGPEAIRIPADVARSLGVRTSDATASDRPRALPPMNGRLSFDHNRLARVRPMFTGTVVALGTVSGKAPTGSAADAMTNRPLREYDRVREGQILAVVRSKELGEKKSELVGALAKLKLDEEQLEKLKAGFKDQAVPEQSVRDAEKAVKADYVAVSQAQRTLVSWGLTDEEIAVVRSEADRLREESAADRKVREDWARYEVRSPRDGTILEKNFIVGDLVDPTGVMMLVGDLERPVVWVHAYDEDLPALDKLQLPAKWTVRVPAKPDKVYTGMLEKINPVLDPNQQTALLTGTVDDDKGELRRVGQFVTVTIELPAPPDEVEVPAAALVEDGRESIVFVQPDPSKPVYERRKVTVARRYHDVAYLSARAGSVRPGDKVVSGGAVLLKDALAELPAVE
jgi:cobalt-zinc-cadmium efflux system membrane fusion protein